MAASVKCPLRFPLTALILKDMNIRGYLFLQFLANLPKKFSMKIALFSLLLKNKFTQSMPDIKSTNICPLKLNIVKLFANINYVIT